MPILPRLRAAYQILDGAIRPWRSSGIQCDHCSIRRLAARGAACPLSSWSPALSAEFQAPRGAAMTKPDVTLRRRWYATMAGIGALAPSAVRGSDSLPSVGGGARPAVPRGEMLAKITLLLLASALVLRNPTERAAVSVAAGPPGASGVESTLARRSHGCAAGPRLRRFLYALMEFPSPQSKMNSVICSAPTCFVLAD
jgi:hypothetical protein